MRPQSRRILPRHLDPLYGSITVSHLVTTQTHKVIYDGITRMCFLAQTDRSKVFLSAVFKKPLTADLDCAKAITHSVGVFMAADMWPTAYRECRFYVYGRCVWATIRLHESIFVSLLCQPCVNEWKLQLFRNYQLHSPLMDGPLGLHRAT